jgi:hypothetical protein
MFGGNGRDIKQQTIIHIKYITMTYWTNDSSSLGVSYKNT